MRNNAPRILFFTKGAVPTTHEVDTAEAISRNVGYRNGALDPGDRPEPCDAVAGPAIPELYKEHDVPVVTSSVELDRVIFERDNPRRVGADHWGEPEVDDTDAGEEQQPQIEYLLNEDGSPVVIDGNMIVKGSPEADKYFADLHDAKLANASEDFKKGFADGETKTEYKPDEVSDEYKNGYTYALNRASEAEAAAQAKADAEANPAPAKAAKPKTEDAPKATRRRAAKKAPAKQSPNKKPASAPGWGT